MHVGEEAYGVLLADEQPDGLPRLLVHNPEDAHGGNWYRTRSDLSAPEHTEGEGSCGRGAARTPLPGTSSSSPNPVLLPVRD
jgi:hypothetical protein